jgi:hypothetical protein
MAYNILIETFGGLDADKPYLDKALINTKRDYKTGKYIITNNYKKCWSKMVMMSKKQFFQECGARITLKTIIYFTNLLNLRSTQIIHTEKMI